MFEKIKIDIAIRKTLRQVQKQHQEFPFLTPYSVRLHKWLEDYQGDTSRLDWLYSLLLNQEEESELAGQHLYLDYDDSGNIQLSLDEDGVFLFSDILQDFFSLDEVRAMWKQLNSRNKIVRVYQDLQSEMQKMSIAELKQYREQWLTTVENYNFQNKETSTEIAQNVLKLVDFEINNKKYQSEK